MTALKLTKIDETQKTCALIGCGALFKPKKKWQEYCTKEHKNLAYFVRIANQYMKTLKP